MELEIIKKEVIEINHKAGDLYKIGYSYYILSITDTNTINFICVEDGNRFTDPYVVNNASELVETDITNMLGDSTYTKVEGKIIIKD